MRKLIMVLAIALLFSSPTLTDAEMGYGPDADLISLDHCSCLAIDALQGRGALSSDEAAGLSQPGRRPGAQLGEALSKAAAYATARKDIESLQIIIELWRRYPKVADISGLQLTVRDPALPYPSDNLCTRWFAEVPKEHWAYNAMDYLQMRGFLKEYEEGYFSGSKVLCRYEFAKAVAGLLDQVGAALEKYEEQIRIMLDTLRAEFSDQLCEMGIETQQPVRLLNGEITDFVVPLNRSGED